ncbi:hypothetical protein [Photobacterium halotolerans]|uniref:hypothetical protein n=1 Tax=Photobacterium halotolerans TaxID=265726 RepID=UPI001929D076|nr:hypothetical protein [Photobacterium halotolerans]
MCRIISYPESKVSNLSIESIQQQLSDLGFRPEGIRIVTVSAMAPELLETCTSQENECFYNSYMNVIYGKGERYVLGYRCEDPIVDHAIIRSGDLYFDPTLQANSDFASYQFAILTEFTVFDMMNHAKSNKDFPPDVDYLFSKANKFKNVITAK